MNGIGDKPSKLIQTMAFKNDSMSAWYFAWNIRPAYNAAACLGNIIVFNIRRYEFIDEEYDFICRPMSKEVVDRFVSSSEGRYHLSSSNARLLVNEWVTHSDHAVLFINIEELFFNHQVYMGPKENIKLIKDRAQNLKTAYLFNQDPYRI